jgi:hypothetical protein
VRHKNTAKDIMTYLRMVTFGNLLGNTFDALLNRFRDRPASGCTLWNALGILLGAIWITFSDYFCGY